MKKYLSALAFLFLFISALTLTANAGTYGSLPYLFYEISDGEVTITDCNTSATSITIPSAIEGYPVRSIGDEAFSECTSLASVTIPESVTSIGEMAFYNCTNLSTVTIPDSVTEMGKYVFSCCTNLKSATISKNITRIDTSTFSSCTKLESIVIPDGATYIGNFVFFGCENLESVSIPDSVTYMGEAVFYGTLCLNNFLSSENDVLYIDNHLIQAKDTLSGQYEIKDGTKTIAGEAFSDCTGLTSIIIPDSVTSIGYAAFSHCTNLAEVTIYDGLEHIGEEAFHGCSSLTSITIPKSVTIIKDCAFGFYTDYDRFGEICKIDGFVIEGYANSSAEAYAKENNITFVSLLNYEIIDGKAIITDCNDNAVSIVIPSKIDGCYVTEIKEDAFFDCQALVSVIIPDSVITIGDFAFRKCTNLKSVEIPDSVTNIGMFAFSNCTSLSEIIIPKSVTEIEDFAFYNSDKVVIKGFQNSFAEIYASDNSIAFVEIWSGLRAKGTSLLLDGNIGIKLYFEYDKNTINKDSLTLNLTLKNTETQKENITSADIILNDDEKTLYTVVCVNPKDMEDTVIAAVLSADKLTGEKLQAEILETTVFEYIEKVKEEATENEEYAKALEVLNALEDYCNCAKIYFDGSESETVIFTKEEEEAISEITYPSITGGSDIGSLEFCSTSLILEDKVTIRHYFKITSSKFNVNYYSSDIGELKLTENGEYVYVDIENIPAHELSKQKTVTVSYAEDEMSVTFSPFNFVKLTYKKDDINLSNLAKALFRYGREAEAYQK